jgi:hypothetical protein
MPLFWSSSHSKNTTTILTADTAPPRSVDFGEIGDEIGKITVNTNEHIEDNKFEGFKFIRSFTDKRSNNNSDRNRNNLKVSHERLAISALTVTTLSAALSASFVLLRTSKHKLEREAPKGTYFRAAKEALKALSIASAFSTVLGVGVFVSCRSLLFDIGEKPASRHLSTTKTTTTTKEFGPASLANNGDNNNSKNLVKETIYSVLRAFPGGDVFNLTASTSKSKTSDYNTKTK